MIVQEAKTSVVEQELRVKNLKKSYTLPDGSKVKVLDGINFSIRRGELVVILGPNGCGKSTLIKIITGIEKSDGGNVEIPGGIRSIGYAPQREILLPWKTIIDNIKFCCKLRGIKIDDKKLKSVLKVLDLENFMNAYPLQLSIGMRQKVNVLIAFLLAKNWLILDEPFSAVDANMRMKLNSFARELVTLGLAEDNHIYVHESSRTILDFKDLFVDKLLSKVGVLYVTHSVDEAIMMADRILILSKKPTKLVEDIRIDIKDQSGSRILDPIERKKHPSFHKYFSEVWEKFNTIFED